MMILWLPLLLGFARLDTGGSTTVVRRAPWWNLTLPNPSLPAAGLPSLVGVARTVVVSAGPEWGEYNHGPQLAVLPDGGFMVSWFNGEYCEDAPGERVLHARTTATVSSDSAITPVWSEPAVLFGRMGETKPVGSSGVLVTNYPFHNGKQYQNPADDGPFSFY